MRIQRGTTESGWDYTREPVRRPDEEGPCMNCGAPLYVGDVAVWVETGDVYCGEACMRRVFDADGEDS